MNLKELARSKGTNLKQVAEKCGIPPTTLYAISRGDTNFENVGIDTVIKVAKALDMTAEELYTGEPSVNYAVVRLGERSDEEEKLLEMYREMDPEYRTMLYKSAVAYVEMTKKDNGGDSVHDRRGTLDAVR